MDRRAFVAGTLALLATPLAAAAQPAGKVHRIGGLVHGLSSRPGQRPLLEAFHQGLRDLGYLEGRDFVLEVRYTEGASERLGPLAAELVALGPDVLVGAARDRRRPSSGRRRYPLGAPADGQREHGGREQRTKKVASTSYVLGDGAQAIMGAQSAREEGRGLYVTKRAKNMLEAECSFSAR